MLEIPEFDQTTIDAAYRQVEYMFDNQDYADEILGIAENDSHFPHLSVEDETPEQEDENTRFSDALDALSIAKFTATNIAPISDLLDTIRDYLEAHNAPEALGGYMNDLAQEINPMLTFLGKSPITLVDDPEFR